MDQDPLVREQIDAGAKFLKEFERFAPVRIAFWLRMDEESQWYLHVASDRINFADFDAAYDEVNKICMLLKDSNFDQFRVKMTEVKNPLVQAALDVYRRYPVQIPTYYGPRYFGGTSVEGVYIYPPPTPVPATTATPP